MPEVYNIGKQYFTHQMEYPTKKFPLLDKGTTQEIEEPFRRGISIVLRAPFSRRALVIGKWTGTQNEEMALSSAIGMREIDVAQEGDYRQHEPQDSRTGISSG